MHGPMVLMATLGLGALLLWGLLSVMIDLLRISADWPPRVREPPLEREEAAGQVSLPRESAPAP